MIRKLISALTVVASFAFVAVSCSEVRPLNESAVKADVRRQNSVSFENLKRSEYEVIGNVKGRGVVKIARTAAGFEFSYDRKFAGYTDEGFVTPETTGWVSNFSLVDELASRIALYDALSKVPGADYIMLPRYELNYEMAAMTNNSMPAFYTNTITATVYGKAIRIKADRELPDTEALPVKAEPVKAVEAVKTNEVTVTLTNVVTASSSGAASSVVATNASVTNAVKKAR